FRFDWRQVFEGAGDHWVAGGALAISGLAGSKLLAADSSRLYLWNEDDSGVLRFVTLSLLVLDLAWYVVLLAGEIVRPRLRYDTRRWATVFPLGMTAAATLSASAAVGVPWLSTWDTYWCGWLWPPGWRSAPGRWAPRGPPGPPCPCRRGSGPEHGDEDVRRGQQADQPEQALVHLLVVPLHVDEPQDHDQQGQLDADLDVVDGVVLGLVEADQDDSGDQHRQRAVQHGGAEAGGALAHRLHLREETAEERRDADDVQADEEVDEYVHEAGA